MTSPADRSNANAEIGGLYIHVPFCIKKCFYCDFFSVTDMSLRSRYVAALLDELKWAATAYAGMRFDTLYLGGGTPSVLETDALGRIVASAFSAFTVLPGAEVTVEVNPATADRDSLRRYRTAGVNRINIGVQSFQNQNLAFLGRIHSAADAVKTLEWAQTAGFENIGIDLIYGIPGQTEATWRQDLDRAAAHRPEHLSCYTLTYEKGTPLTGELSRGTVIPATDEQVAQLYLTTVEVLAQKGYEQYETSNFARSAAHRSRHNGKYWSFAPYLGLGPSSHSFLPPERLWNKADLAAYLADVEQGRRPVAGRESLTRDQLMIEAVYLGLRLIDGIDVAGFESRFKVKFESLFNRPLTVFADQGLLETSGWRCRLTPRGMLLLDTIASSFVDEF